jgi:hypothetical protein
MISSTRIDETRSFCYTQCKQKLAKFPLNLTCSYGDSYIMPLVNYLFIIVKKAAITVSLYMWPCRRQMKVGI